MKKVGVDFLPFWTLSLGRKMRPQEERRRRGQRQMNQKGEALGNDNPEDGECWSHWRKQKAVDQSAARQ